MVIIKYMFIIITIHFFLSINGLKGYFEEDDNDKNRLLEPEITKYLTIIFTSEYQKFMYKKY